MITLSAALYVGLLQEDLSFLFHGLFPDDDLTQTPEANICVQNVDKLQIHLNLKPALTRSDQPLNSYKLHSGGRNCLIYNTILIYKHLGCESL